MFYWGVSITEQRECTLLRKFFQKNQDFLRQSLMLEPRGHSDMYVAIVVPTQKADFGVV
tara:strand:- start:350 stop:526 length:177 start_codon:yes stop_codon:yes gene_type:complete